ncbi:MAG TPA: ABC-F family ATP-binding cassette domain-containing protein [Alloiococcus sp.]|nr:ABC-F family ATP-binding cassette domain-containing protein [Alloiococcus sp.]
MILLQAQKIARHFGADILFDQINLEIKSHARIGLVGRNGAGKSTILHILAGLEDPDEGRVSKQKGLTIGFLDQHTGLTSDRTILEEMLSVFDYVIELEKQLRQMEVAISELDGADEDETKELLQKYDQMQAEFTKLDGYSYMSEIKMVLHGFKFYEEDHHIPINQLSGGQKTRLALAKLLLEKKDLLILDEPTNHLDIETLTWLETYLKNYPGALLMVSHDRYFLDSVVNEIYEISMGNMLHFTGNYSNYLKEKAELIKKQWRDYEKQQKKISDLEDFVQKNIVRASTTKRAQARRKQLQKMDRIEKPQDDEQSAHFSFYTKQTSGDIVVQSDDLYIGYDKRVLSGPINLDIRKEDAIALVGPNGVGKSTLIKTLVDMIPPISGDVKYGTKVDVGYYDQEQQHLDQNKSVLNELWDEHPTLPEVNIRTLLGSFLFSGEDVEKSIHSLSGGERARVALAKLALEKNNFLVLDEPTNHLDIDSKEVLENALIDFDGTLLFVSHDRYFINRMATKVIEVNKDGATLYLGNYDYYLQKKEELRILKKAKSEYNESSSTKEQVKDKAPSVQEATLDRQALKEKQKKVRKLKRHIETIEDDLEVIDEKLMKLSESLNDTELYSDSEKLAELSKKHQVIESKQLTLMEEWESLHLELDELNS